MDLGEIIDRVGVRRPWITVRLDGKGRLAGTLDPPQLAGEVAAGLRDFKALTRPYQEAAGTRGSWPSTAAAWTAGCGSTGAASTSTGPGCGSGAARSRATPPSTSAPPAASGSGPAATADLYAAGRIAEVPWGGLATVEASVAAAPYAVPQAEGNGPGGGLPVPGRGAGRGHGRLPLTRPTLQLTAIEGTQASARYRGEAAVDLFARPSSSPPRATRSTAAPATCATRCRTGSRGRGCCATRSTPRWS